MHTKTWIGAAVAALLAAGGAHAAGSVKFTVTDLGTLGGSLSKARALNDDGVVVGWSLLAGDDVQRAFSTSTGSMVAIGANFGPAEAHAINAQGAVVGSAGNDAVLFSRPFNTVLGNFGSAEAYATGINAQGLVVGTATLADGNTRAFIASDGNPPLDLGTLGGDWARAAAINESDVIVGSSANAAGRERAFVHIAGQMRSIDPFGAGEAVWSRAEAVNSRGDVVGGFLSGNLGPRSFAYIDGQWTELAGDVPGPLGYFSSARGINNQRQIVGDAQVNLPAGFPRSGYGYLHAEGTRHSLNDLLLVDPGLRIDTAAAINNHGQIAANGDNGHALLLTPTGFVEWKGASGSSFNDSANWDSGGLGFGPNKFLSVLLDGNGGTSAVVTAPAQALLVSVGGSANGSGTATLRMAGGALSGDVVIGSRGELTGQGLVVGDVTNFNVVRTAQGQTLTLRGAFVNHGLVTGAGQLGATLSNASDGSLVVGSTQTFTLHGSNHQNSGLVRVAANGLLDVTRGALASSGEIRIEGGTLQALVHGVDNGGLVTLGGVGSVLRAVVNNQAAGRITTERQGQATIDGDLVNDGVVSAASASTLNYLGTVSGTGSFAAGTGARHVFAGRYAPGHSAAAVSVSSADFQGVLEMEIGGLAAGSGHDQISFTSNVWFDPGAVVEVMLIDGFVPAAGQDFGLFSFTRAPLATAAALRLPGLAGGLAWDSSTLFSDGHLRVTAVPEPVPAALLAAGLATLAARRRCAAVARRRCGTG